ncbi:hypothetical protein GEV33_004155 [Tenebrio molitor]|uniref:Sushi domain-containing protein n=1 Tax=Tenebrio molitor TaxID=7067 RepID=A0A8J6HRE8_TENMO|nr:hypothetical protein GEV33_004155 [Tenebrio molitor]
MEKVSQEENFFIKTVDVKIHDVYPVADDSAGKQNEALSETEMVKRVSEAAGIGLILVWQTIKEMEETHAVKSPPRKRNRKVLFAEGLAEILRQEEDMYQLDNIADEMELEFTVNTGSSDESDDLEWELETGDVSTENDVLTYYVGKWSAPVPRCELVKCESLSTPGGLYEPHLQLEEHNNSYGGRAVFSCAWGYRLMGPPGIECELNGNWSGPLPKCVPIQCPPPIIPVNGHLIQSEAAGMDGGRYAVGSLVQFACRGAHQLEGEASIICTENGFWSHPPPFFHLSIM